MFEPKIVAFCCNWCSYAAADLAGVSRMQYPTNVRIIRVPCSGKVDMKYILKAFELGADGVFVAGCLEGNCNFVNGNYEARKRVKQAKDILDALGLQGRRVEMFNIASNQGWRFPRIVEEMTARVDELGPNPLKGEINDYR